MGNATVCSNRLATLSGTSVDATTAATGYAAENLRVFQPGQAWRSTTLALHTLTMTFSEPKLVDTVALIGTNLTAHPNLLAYSNSFDTVSAWTPAYTTVSDLTGTIVAPHTTQCFFLYETTDTAEHKIEQQWTAPGGGDISGDALTVSIYVRCRSGTPERNCRLKIAQTTEYAYQDFDLVNGNTQGSTATSGSVTASASISSVTSIAGTSGFYRISVTATAGFDASDDITVTLSVLDGSFTLSYAGNGSKGLAIAGAQLEFASSASEYCDTTTDTGAIWRMKSDVVSGTKNSAWDYEWVPARSVDKRVELSDRGFINASSVASAAAYTTVAYAQIFDPNNTDGYIQVGTMVVGDSVRPAVNASNDASVEWMEEGDSSRAIGGQLYRPQNKLSRRVTMTHEYLTQAEALGDVYELLRTVGRSRGVLIALDPDGSYPNETTIWGLLESPSPIARRAYSATLGGNVYSTTWGVIEALP